MIRGNGYYRELLIKIYQLKGNKEFTLKELTALIPEYNKQVHYRMLVQDAYVPGSKVNKVQHWKLAERLLAELNSLSINIGGNISTPDTI